MKIVLTIQLQQDNGAPVLTATQTKLNFAASGTANSINTDFVLVRNFARGDAVDNLVKLMAWIANGQLPEPTGAPTLTISNLGT